MSSHYSYDIDERNLRIKLKANEQPFSEDLWLKFEAYQQANQKQQSIDEVVKKLSFTINRNVILPIVFGAIIISFSLLLFNFINIKSKPKPPVVITNTQKPEVKKELTKPLAIKKTVIADIPKKDSVVVTTNSIIGTPSVAIINTVVAIAVAEVKKNATSENVWISLESDKIFEGPNKASKAIGDTRKKEKYNALEETVYFIKVVFTNNGKQQTGFIRKGTLFKNGTQLATAITQTNIAPHKKKERKAENLESIKAPSILSTGTEESEPELK